MIIGILLSLAIQAQAPDTAFHVAKIFADGAVVQRGRPLPVWGSATGGAKITVSFRGATKTTSTDPHGHWRVMLPASTAGGPFEMTIASGDDKRVLHDVLVGDVWFASGQSNMEFALAGARNDAEVVAGAKD